MCWAWKKVTSILDLIQLMERHVQENCFIYWLPFMNNLHVIRTCTPINLGLWALSHVKHRRTQVEVFVYKNMEMHRMTSNWPWTPHYAPNTCQVCVGFTLRLAVSSYRTAYNSSLASMLNVWKRKKMINIQNVKFHNSFKNFGRDPP